MVGGYTRQVPEDNAAPRRYTQDESGVCSDLRPGHTCGVSVDNVVVQNVVTPRAKGKK